VIVIVSSTFGIVIVDVVNLMIAFLVRFAFGLWQLVVVGLECDYVGLVGFPIDVCVLQFPA